MSDEFLPLDLNFSGADLSMPLIVPGNHLCQISAADFVRSKRTADSWNLKLTLKTVDATEDPNGKPVAPGFQLVSYLQIPVPGTEYGEGENKELFVKKLTQFQIAVAGLVVRGDVAPTLPDFNRVYVAELPSKYVIAVTNNNKPKAKEGQAEDEYGVRSQVAAFKPNIPDVAA